MNNCTLKTLGQGNVAQSAPPGITAPPPELDALISELITTVIDTRMVIDQLENAADRLMGPVTAQVQAGRDPCAPPPFALERLRDSLYHARDNEVRAREILRRFNSAF